MYIVALNGSHNKDGNTAYLLKEVLKHCTAGGAECELISVHDAINSAKIPFCVACQSPCEKACYKGTLLDEAFDKVAKADFVLFGSPVYFGSMSAQMKAFFDKTRAPRAAKVGLANRWLLFLSALPSTAVRREQSTIFKALLLCPA